MAATNTVYGIGVQFPYQDANGMKNENNNAIIAAGMALDTGDNTQTSRAMTVHAAAGDYYTDSGAANAYVATIAAAGVAFYAIPSAVGYFAGMRVRIVPANTNTSTSTINVSGLGAKNIFNNGAACIGGELQAGYEATLVYNGTEFDITSVEKNVLLSGNSFDGIVDISTTPYTFLAANAGKLHFSSAAAAATTMPAIAGVTTGTAYYFVNYLATDVTIARDGASTFAGVNGSTTSITVAPYSAVTIAKGAAAVWDVTNFAGNSEERVLSAGNLSASASLAFVLSTLDPTQSVKNTYLLRLNGFQPASDDVTSYLTASTDAGSTYVATGYYGSLLGRDSNGGGLSQDSNNAAQAIVLGASGANESLSNAADETASIELLIKNCNTGTSVRPHIQVKGSYWEAAANRYAQVEGAVSNSAAGDYDAVKLTWEGAGNFAAVGTYALYKLAKPF